jgi:VanZ family protein
MNDKVVHLGLYGILGVALAWGGEKSAWGGTLVLVALGIGYGFLDEWHQGFIPGRDPSAGDLVADAVGVVLGVILGGLLFTRLGD